MNPLISIIIPTYNRAHLIGETLDSVIAQSYQNWECIVVDDGSSDNTKEFIGTYVRKDSRIRFHDRPQNRPKGANACRNFGFEISRGKYVNWFDDDDIMMDAFLQIKRDNFLHSYDFVICSGFYVDHVLRNGRQIILDERVHLFKEYVLWTQHVLTPSILFRRSFLEKKDLFSTKITRGQETEFFSRLFFDLPKNSYKILNIPLFLYRQHSTTVSMKNKNYVKVYRESQSFIAVENLRRSFEIKEFELAGYLYIFLLNFFFEGLKKNHVKNCRYIIKNISSILLKKNKKLAIEIASIGTFLIFIKRGSYSIERRWKSFKFKGA